MASTPLFFSVILGPYGLSGTLTGVSYRLSEPSTQKLLDEWRQFFPIETKASQGDSPEPTMPAAVEVIVGEFTLWMFVEWSPVENTILTPIDDYDKIRRFVDTCSYELNHFAIWFKQSVVTFEKPFLFCFVLVCKNLGMNMCSRVDFHAKHSTLQVATRCVIQLVTH